MRHLDGRRLVLVVGLMLSVLSVLVASAAASGIAVCVPAKEGKPIVTPVKGACKTGYTRQELGKEGKEGAPGNEGPKGTQGEKGEPGLSLLSQGEQEALKDVLPYVKFVASGVGGKPTIQFSGVNVQIVNGGGKTYTTNGAGNLVLGYDEGVGAQTGSHNLVLGAEQTFTSFGGIISGEHNALIQSNAAAIGGEHNSVKAEKAVAVGGEENVANNHVATVLGGKGNAATADSSSVTGGAENTASGENATVTGGQDNTASAPYATIGGGHSNSATAEWASVTGGRGNHANGFASSISGGCKNLTGVGSLPLTAEGCALKSPGEWSELNVGTGASIVAGTENQALGLNSAILGGIFNRSLNFESVVAGGDKNVVEAPGSAISGGFGNTIKDNPYQTIIGGMDHESTNELIAPKF